MSQGRGVKYLLLSVLAKSEIAIKFTEGLIIQSCFFHVLSMDFVDIINVVVYLLYCTSWNTGSAVTGKATCLIWKYYSTKTMQMPFLTAINSSANEQLFLSCWGTALKQTRIKHKDDVVAPSLYICRYKKIHSIY